MRFRFLASASIATLFLASAAAAQTQPTPPDQPQPAGQDAAPAEDDAAEIVVTGIRASLQSAANIKRGAGSIVDAISAEDMGAFPDQNIAESLQRVTGVQIQRDRGEGRDISIRGLDPKFSRILLNGDGLLSLSPITNINPNGPPQPGRSFDFTTLGSDFVQTLVVSKTSTADLEDGGLAGTVDVRTVKPLSLNRNRFSLTVEGLRNAYAKTVGPHVSGAFVGKFFDDTLGVSIGGDYSKRYLQTQSYQSSGQDSRQENQLKAAGAPDLFTNTGSVGTGLQRSFVDWNGDGDNLDAYRFNHLVQFQQDEGTRERQTYNLGLQWRASDKLELNFNGIYAKYKTDFYSAGYSFQTHLGADPTVTGNRVVSSHISDIPPFAGDVVANGPSIAAVCTGPNVCSRPSTGQPQAIAGLVDAYQLRGALVDNITKFNQSKADTLQVQGGAIYKFSDAVRLNVQGSYTRAKRDSILNTGMDAFSYKEVLYDQRTDLAGIPSVGYGAGADALNPATYNSGAAFLTGFVVPQKVTQKIASADLTWEDPLPWMPALKIGYKHVDAELNQTNYNLSVGAFSFARLSGDTLVPGAAANGIKSNGINLTNYMTTYGGADFLSRYNGGSQFPTTWVGPDLRALLAKYPLSQLQALQGGSAAAPVPALIQTLPTNTFRIREIVNAFYFRADLSGFDGALTGNIGLRLAHTKSVADGFTGDPATLAQATVSTLRYESGTAAPLQVGRDYWSPLPSLNLRYDLNDRASLRFAASQTVTRPDFGNMVPSNGLPSLVTQTWTIANPNLEPYYSINLDFGGEISFGRESLLSAYAFKKWIRGYYVNAINQQSLTYRDLDGATQTRIFATTQPVNGSDTTTQGIEVAFQQPFSFLPGALGGFGTLLNYTFTDAGTIQTIAGGTDFPLPFVSKHAANAVLYYEKYGLSARAAYVWRSKYTEVAGGVGGDSRGGSYVKSAGYLDLSTKYQITPEVAITLDAVNVLDTAVERVNIYGFGRGYEVNGRTITGGVRLTF
ncbi:hypothetical protein COC42_07910 [Sphingomonas spermidinifaciens]|uniref:TonB-dependent receptor n=1 Tax=Sphingomonas spermidinifaciens TaxID=1141889 RepID=A0A2A4B9A1_9SPHN|nr:TonB-dependent receptor [Sphingomonas spermidinifaciens]PCD04204.1 hypothetical protein COC42_07910 [Sphingomonas spermidinifaciens]